MKIEATAFGWLAVWRPMLAGLLGVYFGGANWAQGNVTTAVLLSLLGGLSMLTSLFGMWVGTVVNERQQPRQDDED